MPHLPAPSTSAVNNAIRIRSEILPINPKATFVIVTKNQTMETVQELNDGGFRDFGENRVEQFVKRQALLPTANWHFIGRLSRKNVAKVVGKAEVIHSVDSAALLEKIERSCCAAEELFVDTNDPGQMVGGTGRGGENAGEEPEEHGDEDQCGLIQRVLLQVNTSGEGVKQGFSPDDLREFAETFYPELYPHVKVEGLMTMAPFVDNESILRGTFSRLRALKDEINKKYDFEWCELSMGMSNDYAIALEEGSTLVRLGTVVFS